MGRDDRSGLFLANPDLGIKFGDLMENSGAMAY